MDIGRACLAVNAVMYLLYSYKFVVDQEAIFASYNLAPKDFGKVWPTFVSVCRTLGACYFTMSFLMGHTIKTKPSAGVRTAVMMNGLSMMLLLYRKFIEDPNSPNVNAVSLAATEKNLKIIGAFFAISLVGLATVVDPPPKDKKKA